MRIKKDSSAYDALWSEVTKYEQEGKPRSALAAVEPILKKALEEKNLPQRIKALFYDLKYRMTVEEGSEIKAFKQITLELQSADFPAKNMYASILAELYWQYYEINRHKFFNRTEVSGQENEDPSTWDLNTLVKKVSGLYLSSVIDMSRLGQIPIDEFSDILFSGNTVAERPTLFDFLAHRALDFFMNEEVSLTRSAADFQLDDSRLFAETAEFVKLKPVTSGESSHKYQALLIFQQLIRLHLADKEPTALIDTELKRLKFIKANVVGLDANALYLAALNNLADKYRSNTLLARINYEIAYYYYEEGLKVVNDQVSPRKDQQPYLKKAYDLCGEILTRFKNGETKQLSIAKDLQNARALQAAILVKSLELNLENVNIPDEPIKALVKFRNLKQLFLRICLLDEKQRQELDNREYGYGDEALGDFFLKLSPLHTLSFDLPETNDYQMHSAEIKLPALKKGTYVLLASGRNDFVKTENALAYLQFWSSRIGYVQRTDKHYKNEFYFNDRLTGAPLVNLKATLYARDWDNKKSRYLLKAGDTYTADEHGYLRIANSRENYFQLEAKTADDRLFLNQQFYEYGNAYASSSSNQQWLTTHFFTDRAIYRPGQTIYFKGLIVESEQGGQSSGFKARIKPNYRTSVQFLDVNGQLINKLDVVTNAYGTFSGSFIAPQDRLNGEMQIQNEYGQAIISVEEYKRPKFEVAFKPVTTAYRLGEQVKINGEAKAYAGAVIDEAEVRFRVVRRAVFPYWNWWWGYPPHRPETVIKQGVLKTDTQGLFTIEFEALPDLTIAKREQPIFYYDISADVTDIAGETHSNQTSVTVGYVAMVLDANIPEQIERDQAAGFKLTSTNLNGQFEPAKGQLVIHKLKDPDRSFRQRLWPQPDLFLYTQDEYYQSFPYDAYADEDNRTTWKKERKVLDKHFDTQAQPEVTFGDMANWEQGSYVAELQSKDKYNEPVTVVKYFTLYSLNTPAMPVKASHWVVPVKVKGEPGETAQLLVGSSDPDVSGFYEIIQNQDVLESHPLQLNNEKKLIKVPIKEEYRGNFSINIVWGKYNRCYTDSEQISVDWSNKDLKLEFETFRDKLEPGAKEEWRIKLSGKQSEKISAEMVASLYDASLDVFKPHNWYLGIYPAWGPTLAWNAASSFLITDSRLIDYHWNNLLPFTERTYDRLNYFNFSLYQYGNRRGMMLSRNKSEGFDGVMNTDIAPAPMLQKREAPEPAKADTDGKGGGKDEEKERKMDTQSAQTANKNGAQSDIKVRSNLQETAFFFPHVETDTEGRFVLAFVMPEALTRWRLLALAHTKDLAIGRITKELVTQKSLMIMPHTPRFLRQGDKIILTAKVSNLSTGELAGEARLELLDALTMQPLDTQFGLKQPAVKFNAKQGQSASLAWELSVPDTAQAVTCRMLAKAGEFSDGEEATLPVLTNRQLVTEAQPLTLREAGKQTFRFEKLFQSGSSATLRQHRLTLEFTTNPAWYAVQALPYLMEYPYECTEQVFSRYYANSLAAFIANSQPKLKKVFDSWKNTPNSQVLLSNLEKNQELKALLLEETPWVLDAKDETQRKYRLGLLFDLNHMAQALGQAFRKVQEAQTPGGGWSWFPGLPEDRYITQHIVAGLGHLDHLGVFKQEQTRNGSAPASSAEARSTMLQKAVNCLDNWMQADYQRLITEKIDLNKNNLNYLIIHYLYARSFFKNWPLDRSYQTAFDYWLKQVKTYWLDNSLYMKGLSALVLYRYKQGETARQILASLKETAVYSEELGMYWKELSAGSCYWYQAPIETEALLIEAFNEIAGDSKTVDELRLWLIKQKQTLNWPTTKATTEACYALLLTGGDWLTTDASVAVTVGGESLAFTGRDAIIPEAGTGYFKKVWNGPEIKPAQGEVTVSKSQPGPAWGALYWQYFEDLDKITSHATPLQLVKQVFLRKETDKGPVLEPITANTHLKPGALLKVRLELRVDRDMEYIHLKDMRAAGLEPINVISRYQYQDGLWYYESTKDAVTNFFIPSLAKGTYVFEYPLRISHSGDFSNGLASIQSMYAPEFNAHSEGIRIKVD